MILTYDFDNGVFEYEVNPSDFIESLSVDDMIEFAEYVYDNMSDKEKYEYSDIIEDDTSYFKNKNDEDVQDTALRIAMSADDMTTYNFFRDAIDKFYYDEAKDSYEDYKEYSDDPLGYVGMSQDDFI